MTFAGNDDTMSYTMNHQYAQTIAFSSIPITTGDEISGDMMKRRVSFAPNAHVR